MAADMGGAGYLFTGEHDAEVLHNSALINLNVALVATKHAVHKLLFTSSACIYPDYNQLDPESPNCTENTAYPAQPDSEYGWEKLFGERLDMAYSRNYGTQVRIARLHNVFGPEGAWNGGRGCPADSRKSAATVHSRYPAFSISARAPSSSSR